jgi:small subunit ribosomal protein S16
MKQLTKQSILIHCAPSVPMPAGVIGTRRRETQVLREGFFTVAVKLRLMRLGRRNKAFFRIVAMDGRDKQKGECLEIIGWYDPVRPDQNFQVNKEAAEKWLGNGAIPTETVVSLFKKSGVMIPASKARVDKRQRAKKA